jgi:hypothetical protein
MGVRLIRVNSLATFAGLLGTLPSLSLKVGVRDLKGFGTGSRYGSLSLSSPIGLPLPLALPPRALGRLRICDRPVLLPSCKNVRSVLPWVGNTISRRAGDGARDEGIVILWRFLLRSGAGAVGVMVIFFASLEGELLVNPEKSDESELPPTLLR